MPPGRGLSDAVRQAAPYMGVGISLAATIGVALYLGHWLDRKFGTAPLWFLVGAAFGLLGAFYHLFKVYRSSTRKP